MVNCQVLYRNEFVFSIEEQDNVGQHRGHEDYFISTAKRIQITETCTSRTKRIENNYDKKFDNLLICRRYVLIRTDTYWPSNC